MTAYFSKTRMPGVVLRVSRISVPQRFVASTNLFASVAVAHMRCMKLSATRSAERIEIARPEKAIISSPGFTQEPSALSIFTLSFGSTAFITARATVVPETTHGTRE